MRIAILTTDNREHHRRYELPEPYFGPAIEALLQGFSGIGEMEVHIVACTQKQMAAPTKLAPNIFFHLLHVPKIGWLRTGYQGCVRAVRRKLGELEPDLVHGQGTERECALAAVFSGFPNLLTLLGNMRQVAKKVRAPIGSYAWCAARLESLALRRTGGVLANSSYTEALVKPLARRSWLVPNALRRELFDSPPSRHTAEARPTLLNIGAIVPYKRQNELLAMARRLHQQRHRFELLFVGEASAETAYAADFRQAIARATEEGFARHIGSKPIDELIECLDQAQALIHISLEESFGLVVAEGLARNLKFFGTAAGGVIDIASEVEGAELFASGDEARLEAALSKWLETAHDPPQSAATAMRSRYHPDVIAAQHMRVYRAFLGESAATR